MMTVDSLVSLSADPGVFSFISSSSSSSQSALNDSLFVLVVSVWDNDDGVGGAAAGVV